MSDDDVVRALISFFAQGRPQSELSAWNHVASQLTVDPPHAWQLLQRAIELAPSDDVVETIGEDLLEDLLALHGPDLVDRILDDARSNPRIVTALRCASGDTRFDGRVLQKVARFLKACE